MITKVKEPSGGVLFGEKQSFPQWLLYLIIFFVCIATGGILVDSVTKNANTPLLWVVGALVLVFQLIIVWVFHIVRLEKVLTRDGLYYRWTPFQNLYRYIPYGEIDSFEIRKSPVLRYGYRKHPRYGTIHNLGPGEGVQLYLRNGSKIFFGTADQLMLQQALKELRLSEKTAASER